MQTFDLYYIFLKFSFKGILDLPALVFIQSGIPNFYEGDDLMNVTEVEAWITEEAKGAKINEVTKIVLNKLTDKIEHLAVIFYDMDLDPTVEKLQSIAEDCQENDIGIVKINDASEAEYYGLKDQPVAMFINNHVPSLMVGNIEDPDEVWKGNITNNCCRETPILQKIIYLKTKSSELLSSPQNTDRKIKAKMINANQSVKYVIFKMFKKIVRFICNEIFQKETALGIHSSLGLKDPRITVHLGQKCVVSSNDSKQHGIQEQSTQPTQARAIPAIHAQRLGLVSTLVQIKHSQRGQTILVDVFPRAGWISISTFGIFGVDVVIRG